MTFRVRDGETRRANSDYQSLDTLQTLLRPPEFLPQYTKGLIQNRLGKRHLQVAVNSEMQQAQGGCPPYTRALT